MVYLLMKPISFHSKGVVLPKLLNMDEIPLARTKAIVLDAREGEHLVLGVHDALDEVE